ncbi:acetate--CoA ligase [Hymenobacter properus]|uniref:Acetate--CoA ligase n=1 Tax=Hymenobacter properus TaxID=2791026 RepID=A0A931BBP6_9BACT|nr:acetate--CoA ligase [Hymenobacter properus]MBF9140344.1 acetate--CoA ligase [Hymenobacter properus]MBR7719151.1 acetate--CoA ligase [Microvirga sp. SRT04]
MSVSRIRTLEEYHAAYQKSVEDPDAFWADVAEPFTWRKKWDTVRSGEFSPAGESKWFDGARLNITENCLDRHLALRGNKLALIFEPNDPKTRHLRLTYRELYQQVCQFANVLHANGVEKGDRVIIYLPMIPQLAIAVLACARIGAVHSVVFAGFSATAIADRVNDADAHFVLTADGLNRGPKQIPVKSVVDEALLHCPGVRRVIVVEHLGWPVHMQPGRDVWYHEEAQGVPLTCPAEEMKAEDPLFILYTSGSTGKPKGVVHTTAGYMVWADYTFRNVFQVEENDVYWCTADIGWVTGHTYLLYGPLLAGSTSLQFEGVPTYPDAGRFWEVIDKHNVTIFYTAPTAIRSLMATPLDNVLSYSLSSLRVLGSVGEPINEEAWHWYHTHIGKGRCPVVDTWWQTETGGIMLSALADITPSVPARAGLPLPGVQPVLLNQDGTEIEGNDQEGYLAIKASWPAVIRTTWGDHERARQTYFQPYPGYYFTGDGARRDEQGLYRIIGRVDDVINVSGHRFGTAEIENAINQNEHVVESAVVGYPHDVKGQGIYAYVICQGGPPKDAAEARKWESSIIETVVAEIGKIAKPDKIQLVSGLPKTRSGKIMRRILRKVAEGETSNLGDVTTLLDPAVVDEILTGRK